MESLVSHNIIAIPALNDNYIWMIVHPRTQQAMIVDPGEATPVLQVLKEYNINLAAILITHHHWDHTNGIEEIIARHKAPVYAPLKDNVANGDHPIKGGDEVEIPTMELKFQVIDIPGHTVGHVAYQRHQWAFTGDTLFTGGCGRIFEGTPDELYHSLCSLAELPLETHVYCGHEYTAANLRFAELVDPNNLILQKRIIETDRLRSRGLPTVPSTIALELQTNPFLRCHLPEIQAAVGNYCGEPLADTVAVFAALRRWKDEI